MSRPGYAEAVAAGTGEEIWGSPAWRDGAVAWIDARLAERGRTRTAEAEQPHLRSWATVLRLDTDLGPAWFKAGGLGQAFEAGLYAVLQRRAPGRVLEPLAADVDRGWLLLPDGGPSLGQALQQAGDPDRLVDAFCTVLPQYADLQRTVAPYAEELLAAGCVDMVPAAMPARYDEALAEAERFLVETGAYDGQDAAELLRRLVAHRPEFADRCGELAAGPVAPTLQHDDLHAWNVFDRHHDRQAVFFDWGDSVVGHPFATLLVTMRSLQAELETTTDDPRLRRARDAYLAAFDELGSPAELRRWASLACHVGTVTRALTWVREIALASPETRRDLDGAQLRWLLLSLVDEPLVAVGAD